MIALDRIKGYYDIDDIVDVINIDETGDSVQTGFCILCGENVESLEPDAHRVQCPTCKSPTVSAIATLITNGSLGL
jgi:hypothetical protein